MDYPPIPNPPEAAAAQPPPPTDWGYSDVALVTAVAVLPVLLLQLLAMLAGDAEAAAAHTPGFAELIFTLVVQSVLWALVLGCLYYVVSVKHGWEFWPALGWRAFDGRILNYFSLGVMLALGVGLISQILPMPEEQLPLEQLLETREAVIALAIFGVFIAPPVEELVFRGFLYRVLERLHGVAPAIAGTAFVFSLLHAQQYGYHSQILLVLFVVGSALGWIRAYTGSVIASTVTHATYNGVLFAGLLFVDEETLKQLESAGLLLF